MKPSPSRAPPVDACSTAWQCCSIEETRTAELRPVGRVAVAGPAVEGIRSRMRQVRGMDSKGSSGNSTRSRASRRSAISESVYGLSAADRV